VPFFGTFVSTLLPALFVLPGDGGGTQALLVVLLGTIIHVAENQLVVPLLMHKKVDLPPVLTIMSVLISGKLLGPFGLVVAVLVVLGVLVMPGRLWVGQRNDIAQAEDQLAELSTKIERVRAAGLRSLAIFKAAGVKMALGTDLLGGSHGLQSEELLIRAQVQSNLEVLQSATLIGAELLGQAGQLGEVSPGARADLLLVDGDPLQDLRCLTGQGEGIALVMQAGRIVIDRRSGPTRPPTEGQSGL